MLRVTLVNVLCALLLAQASSAVVIQNRSCRMLHTDTDTGHTATVDCTSSAPTSSYTSSASSSSSSCTDSTTTTSSSSYVPTSSYTPPVTTTTTTTSYTPPVTSSTSSSSTSTSCTDSSTTTTSSSSSCHKCTGTGTTVYPTSSSTPPPAPTTTAPGGVPPPHSILPNPTPEPKPSGPYKGKFFQIIPKGQENLCLSVFSGDETLSGSDGVNVQECDCDHPLYKNTWTLDETSQYTTIMSGKPKMAGDKTWCLDAGSRVPADTTKPHLWECLEEPNTTPIAVQNWHLDDKSGQISIDFEGKTWCLDREFGEVNDRPVQIWDCVEGNANQQWEVRFLEAAK